VVGGEVAGRLPRLTLGDSLFQMFGRVRAVGRELEWAGAVGAPALVLDSVVVSAD
jgi:predicted Zn-dependent protease